MCRHVQSVADGREDRGWEVDSWGRGRGPATAQALMGHMVAFQPSRLEHPVLSAIREGQCVWSTAAWGGGVCPARSDPQKQIGSGVGFEAEMWKNDQMTLYRNVTGSDFWVEVTGMFNSVSLGLNV